MPFQEDVALERTELRAAEDESATRTNQLGFGRYLATMSFFLVALYCFPLYMVRRADFDELSNTPYSMPLNYGFKLADDNADVVIFGDSTALHGIDPSQMSRELGFKVVNIPNTGATLRVMDDLSLRRYLKTNRPPRLLVFYFAAWDMDYLHTELPIGTYEGKEVLAHQGTAGEIWEYAWNHPAEALEFPFQYYLANSSWRAVLQRPYRYAGAEASRTQGYFSNPSPRRLSPSCEFWPSVTQDLRVDSVKALGTKYATPKTKVLYYVAPVPGCLNAPAVVNRSWSDLPAAPPRVLPVEMFRGSVMYLHPAPEAVPAVTDELVDAVRLALAEAKPQ